eukprot:9700096-Lingulodinium_polyedra.AAC.1
MEGAAVHLVRGFERAGCKLSSKSLVIGSSTELREAFVRAPGRRGIPVGAAAQARDLGIDTSTGRARATGVQAKRPRAAKTRARRIRQALRHCRAAR